MSPSNIFISAFIVGFSGAIMPGPLLLVTISQTLKVGLIASLMIVGGHALLELFATIGLSFGLKEVMTKPLIFRMIGIIGGLFMIWMAVGMFRSALKNRGHDFDKMIQGMREQSQDSGSRIGKPFGLGIVVSLSNPYWTIWWVTVGAAFVTKALQGSFVLLPSFFVGHILADLVWYGAVGLSITLGGRFINGYIYRAFIFVCSSFLGVFGIYFLYTGLKGGFALI